MFSFRGESDTSTMEVPKLTLEQAIIVSGYTHVMALDDSGLLFTDVEKRLGRKIKESDYLDPNFGDEMKELYREDYIKMAYNSGFNEKLMNAEAINEDGSVVNKLTNESN